MPMNASAGSRIHAAEGGDATGRAGVPPVIASANEGRIRRYWRRAWSTGRFLWHSLSVVGTVLMLLYQIIYPWQWWPNGLMWMMPSSGASAWLMGFVMFVIYIASKLPHLIGQEPGDTAGLVREVLLNQVNIIVAVVFLTRVQDGMSHPLNAIGISLLLLVGFLALLVAELVQAIVLARRTWTDSSGGGDS